MCTSPLGFRFRVFSYASTISYLTLPAENAGLYKGLMVGPLLRRCFAACLSCLQFSSVLLRYSSTCSAVLSGFASLLFPLMTSVLEHAVVSGITRVAAQLSFLSFRMLLTRALGPCEGLGN